MLTLTANHPQKQRRNEYYLKLDLPSIRPLLRVSSELDELIEKVDVFKKPELIDDGCGTVYKLCGHKNEELLIFKPEEYENERTPFNELAAYLIDAGMAGVAPTSLVEMKSEGKLRVGSVQKYLTGTESAADYGTGVFNVDDVHKIGVLDIRVVNCDRHSGNILFNEKTKKLIPIDHGLCFPSAFTNLGDASFDWLLFPQAKEPFSADTLKQIEEIDLGRDLEVLDSLGFTEDQLLSVLMSTTMLKIGARQGKTLFEIGSMIQRQGDRESLSVLEILFSITLEQVLEDGLPCSWKVFEDEFTIVFKELSKLLCK
mmetsp:Transcript_9877/g.11288  ORF Transcript_9877/g.11288 Transcript_9877/m.11288 type:complete len:314 (+) Transcript_9877:777-1718(+)